MLISILFSSVFVFQDWNLQRTPRTQHSFHFHPASLFICRESDELVFVVRSAFLSDIIPFHFILRTCISFPCPKIPQATFPASAADILLKLLDKHASINQVDSFNFSIELGMLLSLWPIDSQLSRHHELKSLNPPEVFIFFLVVCGARSAVSASLANFRPDKRTKKMNEMRLIHQINQENENGEIRLPRIPCWGANAFFIWEVKVSERLLEMEVLFAFHRPWFVPFSRISLGVLVLFYK